MTDAYNTDGMYGMPIQNPNCLESIERAIAFDVRDWGEDRRSAWIYGIVFGWSKDSCDELQGHFQWLDSEVERMNRLHSQWCELKEYLKSVKGDEE